MEQGHEQAILPNNINERFRIIVPEALNRFPVCIKKNKNLFQI